MKKKTYNVEEQPPTMAGEPATAYGRTVADNDGILSAFQSQNASVSKPGRMTVEEYFNEARKVLHKKYKDLQG
jgi:hypothetical protein